jgi:hypothetical protein
MLLKIISPPSIAAPFEIDFLVPVKFFSFHRVALKCSRIRRAIGLPAMHKTAAPLARGPVIARLFGSIS